MKRKRLLTILLVLIATATLAARPQDPHTRLATAEWSELTGSMNKMHSTMASLEQSGNSDLDFVSVMLPHHQAAIDMARTESLYGKDPQMRRLAQEILTEQQSEIELMQLWLKQRAAQK